MTSKDTLTRLESRLVMSLHAFLVLKDLVYKTGEPSSGGILKWRDEAMTLLEKDPKGCDPMTSDLEASDPSPRKG